MKRTLLIIMILGIFYAVNAQSMKQGASSSDKSEIQTAGKSEFMPLPYAYDALEPYIDKMTVEIHYGKHYRAYYDNFMKAIKGTPMESMTILDIFKDMSKYPVAVRNNGGGFYNHMFYWENMKPKGGGLPAGKLAAAISKSFGSFDEFKKQFTEAGTTRFGSGWAWLCDDGKGNLFICSTPNQDNPLMDLSEKKGTPLLTMDVWEHAYYLKYQNRRADYENAFFNLINWDEVAKRYDTAMKQGTNK